jgi:tripartite ATP-independent transporter DctM subunit
MYRWFGRIPGGLAAGSVVICALFAAMVGLTTVATATLGVSALPSMLSRGYDKKFASGIIMGGACIGIIIPPSVTMIIYAAVTETSPGKMFMAGVVPGIFLSLVLIIYCLVYAKLFPDKAPALPADERFTLKEKIVSLKGIILPLLLILSVIGSILSGLATPTEAAAVGVAGSLLCALLKKTLNKESLKQIVKMTVNMTIAMASSMMVKPSWLLVIGFWFMT